MAYSLNANDDEKVPHVHFPDSPQVEVLGRKRDWKYGLALGTKTKKKGLADAA